MKILHLTNHRGTKKSIEHMCQQLNLLEKLTTETIYSYYYIDRNLADSLWQEYKEKIKNYDILLFTDTSMVARPFLQHIDEFEGRVIVYITNRFDWGMFGFRDEDYYTLYSNISKHPKVHFCADNTYDQYYASTNNIERVELIKLTPLLSSKISLPINDRLFIYNRGTKIEHYRPFLDKYDIAYDVFGENNPYRDVEHIEEYVGILHLPYQTNIQSLWENLGYNIIYFIPSKQFFIKLLFLENSWYYWEERKRSIDFFLKSIDICEWYHPDNEELFEYFDSWEDLKGKMKKITQEKKKKIHSFMQKHNHTNLEKWNFILSSQQLAIRNAAGCDFVAIC